MFSCAPKRTRLVILVLLDPNRKNSFQQKLPNALVSLVHSILCERVCEAQIAGIIEKCIPVTLSASNVE